MEIELHPAVSLVEETYNVLVAPMPRNVTCISSAISWADIGCFDRRLNISSSAAVRKILDSINFLLKPRMASGFIWKFPLQANDYYIHHILNYGLRI